MINNDLKRVQREDLRILLGVCLFFLSTIAVMLIGASGKEEKLKKQLKVLQYQHETLRNTVRADIADREGNQPYLQVVSHMKSLGL